MVLAAFAVEGVNAEMNLEYLVGGLAALLMMIYLVVALLWPERF